MKNRYWNFFRKDGKCLILALDFGCGGNFPIDNPGTVISDAVDAGADAVLTNYGVIKNYRKEIGHAGVMLRVDLNGSVLSQEYCDEVPEIKWNIGNAVRELAIDGAMCMGCIGKGIKNGVNYDTMTIKAISKLVEECDKYGIISAAEMLPNGFSEDPADRTHEKMKFACRCAAESGVDFVKTAFVGPAEEYSKVVDNCYVPIVALGGGKKGTREFLKQCKEAMDSGCKGLAIGRNIWGSDDVKGMVTALNMIVHENATVDEAIKQIKGAE